MTVERNRPPPVIDAPLPPAMARKAEQAGAAVLFFLFGLYTFGVGAVAAA